jgi:Icc protein
VEALREVESVSLGQALDVALVEELDVDVRIDLAQPPQLAVFAGGERLLHHRQFEVEILLGEVEVGRERLDDAALVVALEDERARLVLPRHAVVVEDLRALPLVLARERRLVGAEICLETGHFKGFPQARVAAGPDAAGARSRLYTSHMPRAEDGVFRIAHVSDLHCGGPYFMPSLLERALAEINELEPDIVVCSGDLTTFGFKQEYAQAKGYLDRVECDSLVVVPGNHDSRNVGYLHFEELFGERYSVERVDGVTVVAVDSTEPDLDHGQIGRGRYRWIEEQFATPAELRIFVLHHHLLPVPGTGRERNIVYDAGDVIECLQRAGVNLVLSGHKHVPYAWRLENLFVVNTGTVSSLRLRGNTRPCYNVVEIVDSHVDVWRKYPFHGQERVIQFSTDTLEFEKYTARIEGEVTTR